MTFDWSNYLGFAEETLSRVVVTNQRVPPPEDEARIRASVSRAYYAAHHIARNLAEHEGGRIDRKEPHASVIDHFFEARASKRKQISLNLRRLRDDRIHADYQGRHMQWSIARSAVSLARTIISDIESL